MSVVLQCLLADIFEILEQIEQKLDLVICNTVTGVIAMTNKTIGQGRQYEQYSRRWSHQTEGHFIV